MLLAASPSLTDARRPSVSWSLCGCSSLNLRQVGHWTVRCQVSAYLCMLLSSTTSWSTSPGSPLLLLPGHSAAGLPKPPHPTINTLQ